MIRFGGTMTTGAVAKQTGRFYTMIERDETYIRYGEKRLSAVVPKIGYVENAVFDIKPQKVSMTEMINANYFIIGENFYHKNGKSASLVNDKGYLQYGDQIDSMHEIAAKMMNGKRRVNAFDYLFVIRNGGMVSISDIRENYRRLNFH